MKKLFIAMAFIFLSLFTLVSLKQLTLHLIFFYKMIMDGADSFLWGKLIGGLTFDIIFLYFIYKLFNYLKNKWKKIKND